MFQEVVHVHETVSDSKWRCWRQCDGGNSFVKVRKICHMHFKALLTVLLVSLVVGEMGENPERRM